MEQGDSNNMTTTQIKSKTIQVNGVPVTCYSDGSLSTYRINRDETKEVRTFGSVHESGYRLRFIKYKQIFVHTLIARAFLGEKPEGHQVDHINGDKADNRPENLRYVNNSQNLRGARRVHGERKYRGVGTHRKRFRTRVLGKHAGVFDTELEAAERFDDVAFYEHNFPLEGLYDELKKDKERLDWILSDAGRVWLLNTRADIDKEMNQPTQ